MQLATLPSPGLRSIFVLFRPLDANRKIDSLIVAMENSYLQEYEINEWVSESLLASDPNNGNNDSQIYGRDILSSSDGGGVLRQWPVGSLEHIAYQYALVQYVSIAFSYHRLGASYQPDITSN